MSIYLGASSIGKSRRFDRLVHSDTGRMLLVPFDDSLIAGPSMGLERIEEKLRMVFEHPPDAILGFSGVFRHHAPIVGCAGWILNLTASTTVGVHTRKVQVATVEQAIELGCDGVAVHINITSAHEPEMLRSLGGTVRDAERYGLPVMAIAYPRRESGEGDDNYSELRTENPNGYARLVAHACRVAVELGADLIKTQFTGGTESFRSVVEACKPVPVIAAGGPLVSEDDTRAQAKAVMAAGASGISFGRNVFGRDDPRRLMRDLLGIVHGRAE